MPNDQQITLTNSNTPTIIYKPSEVLGIIASYFSQLTAQNTRVTKDLNNAKDQARELERQLNELQSKGGYKTTIILVIIVTAIVVSIFCLLLSKFV